MKSEEPKPIKSPESDAYHGLVEHMHELYQGVLSERDAHQAARNLIGFCQVLLEIKRQNP
ncbi:MULTISPECIES: hypothetical protein [unclassified Spirosoma]|uniref:hypothetical protein n=1 Tax=unclassified Spirosoma TaxID=2621999 RepID=UPI00095C3E88|nr:MULTISPECIES: hypothetical protein [unclassified Spirosoma]MBN8820637.1 hypothetical protein [Spirosoma sp.]OJW70522.1 MAG: hypothetical protein BGO59_25125 [Spirosoma sp. 48-14]